MKFPVKICFEMPPKNMEKKQRELKKCALLVCQLFYKRHLVYIMYIIYTKTVSMLQAKLQSGKSH